MALQTFVLISCIAGVLGLCFALVERVHVPRWWYMKSQLIGQMSPQQLTGFECPYEYLRNIYGKHHWAHFVNKLSPKLRYDNYPKYLMVLEMMDTIHLCLMLVDDVRAISLIPYNPSERGLLILLGLRSPTEVTIAKDDRLLILYMAHQRRPIARTTESHKLLPKPPKIFQKWQGG